MSFLSCEEMLAAARSQNISLSEAILRSDLAESRLTEAHSREMMHHLWQVMQATSRDYDPAQRSRSGLSGGDAAKVEQAHQEGKSLGGDYLAAVTAEALKTAECNACMKRIVAAPTAGSCGVLPAVLLPYQQREGLSDEAMVRAMYVAGAIGQVVAAKASIAGAAGGCQAEIGTASAMGAAALCYLGGGDAQAVCHAAAIAIKAMLGLVCDPIAGLVEVPCVKRNAAGAVIAMSSADMALAGIRSAVPPDEVILAMREVGDKMDVSLKETGVGGVAGTPFGQKIAEKMGMA